jgi:hypothetical protein
MSLVASWQRIVHLSYTETRLELNEKTELHSERQFDYAFDLFVPTHLMHGSLADHDAVQTQVGVASSSPNSVTIQGRVMQNFFGQTQNLIQ